MTDYKVNDRILYLAFDEYWPGRVNKITPKYYFLDFEDGGEIERIEKTDKKIIGKISTRHRYTKPLSKGVPKRWIKDWLDLSKDRKQWEPKKLSGKTQKRAKYSLRGLMLKQYGDVRAKAETVTIRNIKKSNNDGGGYVAYALDTANDPTTEWHTTSITGVNPDLRSNFEGLKLSCSCKRFLFHHEYALTYHGMSHIKYSNGEPPLKTNPRFRNSFAGIQICKHLYSLATKLLKK